MAQVLEQIANDARGLAIDAVKKANSGHLGLPLGCAELGALLFGKLLRYNPSNPRWLNRDRFVLSAGHGSVFLYTWLHLSGYAVSLEEIKNFRQIGSLTPGHPEFGKTPGVEATTGPLGQGIGNAVGMAVSLKHAVATFNTEEHTLFDASVVCLCGDGCLQEGVALESLSLAGHWGLNNLILIYDSNQVTLDAPLAASQSEDVAKKFESLGWEVQSVSAYDFEALESAYLKAKLDQDKPQLIIARTLIGKGIAQIEGSSKAHGATGIQFADEAKMQLNLPQEPFYISESTRAYFKTHRNRLQKAYQAWESVFNDWSEKYPDKAKLLTEKKLPNESFWQSLEVDLKKPAATRVTAGEVLRQVATKYPLLVSGSADLHESTKNFISNAGVFSKTSSGGRNFMFGVREHAMGAILNGIAYEGIFMPSGATFLAFSDYLKPAIRLAAMSHLPVLYFFTHDSIAVGEDGPTHQPVEQLAGLRSTPNLYVIRPADSRETLGAFQAAFAHKEGPTALILSRQNLPPLVAMPSASKREGVLKGAYIVLKEQTDLRYLLLASGSEVRLGLEIAKLLGPNVRVVSMPCMEIFQEQSVEYRESILPPACLNRIAIEMGSSQPWYRYVGAHGLVIGMDSFGKSAPEEELNNTFGFTPKSCFAAIRNHFEKA